MVKRIIRIVLGQTSLNFEELNTILRDCESVFNGRPLTYVSDYTSDLEPLTPSLFLQEVREVGIPDLDLLDNKFLNKRFAYRQRLQQDLRKRFRYEYLGQLRQSERKIRKVIEVFTSRDGNIKLVKLKSKSREILRPTLRLYPLEVSEHEKELFQKCEPPVKTFTCDDSSAAERDSLHKAEPDEPTSRYGRSLKRVPSLRCSQICPEKDRYDLVGLFHFLMRLLELWEYLLWDCLLLTCNEEGEWSSFRFWTHGIISNGSNSGVSIAVDVSEKMYC
ncbi:hypothetical protein AVEN_11332-1 [Araneus ventricosus]|uniref:DUF5641 domain-containing protein n=1 Tax=Araneus ventricosus TaxID=182803 RepID=A0A4Y2PGZ3_ARAVE|nr:hypothetical protein AVEN_11332-1 [Araneus ventricosus]